MKRALDNAADSSVKSLILLQLLCYLQWKCTSFGLCFMIASTTEVIGRNHQCNCPCFCHAPPKWENTNDAGEEINRKWKIATPYSVNTNDLTYYQWRDEFTYIPFYKAVPCKVTKLIQMEDVQNEGG